MKLDGSVTQVLLVEDNSGDVRLVTEALGELQDRMELNIVHDGSEAIAFLRREGAFAQAPHMDLVLLDLNLPRRDGREVLAEMKGDVNLRRTPVIVFSSSNAQADIAACYDLHANCYVIKPFGLEEFTGTVKSIASFWLGMAILPPR